MKIQDILKESTSLESTLTAIINDIGTPIANIYPTIRHAIQRTADNNGLDNTGNIKGLGLIIGGETSRWRESFYNTKLKNELFDLVKYKPNITTELKAFLTNTTKTNVGLTQSELPEILMKIAQRLNNRQLYLNAERWVDEQKELFKFIKKVTAETAEYENRGYSTSDTNDKLKDTPKKQDPGIASYAKQNTQVEQIVNDVLSKINKDVAGQIRNAIARSGNKLLALQQELAKRKITVKESFL